MLSSLTRIPSARYFMRERFIKSKNKITTPCLHFCTYTVLIYFILCYVNFSFIVVVSIFIINLEILKS